MVGLVVPALAMAFLAVRVMGWTAQRDAAKEGAQLYTASCVKCHGEGGNRIPVAPLGTLEYLEERGDPQLMDAVSRGKSSMPAFARATGGSLSAEQIEAVVLYLRSPQGPARRNSPAGGPNSRDLYVDSCASCHGLDGAKLPQARIGSEEYVNSRGESALTRIILTGQGGMPAFASSLQGDQVKGILGYLRTLGPRSKGAAEASASAPSGSSLGIPHSVEGRADSCLVCHGPKGMLPFPGDHAGRSNRSCLSCHKASSAAASAASATPRVPHELQGREECLSCHGPKGLRPVPASHDGRGKDSCMGCHQTVELRPAGGIPRTPHDLAGREDCLGCHKTGFLQTMPADHAGRSQDKCKECHKPAQTAAGKATPQIRHDIARAEDCLMCHGPKPNRG